MRSVVKPINSCSSVHIWSSNISRSAKFSCKETNQTSFLSHVNLSRWSKIFYKWLLHSFIRLQRASSGFKEKQTSVYHSQSLFAVDSLSLNCKKVEINFSIEKFSLKKNSMSDMRKVWGKIRVNTFCEIHTNLLEDVKFWYLQSKLYTGCPKNILLFDKQQNKSIPSNSQNFSSSG